MGAEVSIDTRFCKGCGICAVLCPKKILIINEENKACVTDQDRCTACRQCEYHCPDFAITIGGHHGQLSDHER
ncbi:MAG: 4Fe-4S binding protein [Solobacterium sp.]|nr:4Fe-4S binding protein [Solobacterium sp.]